MATLDAAVTIRASHAIRKDDVQTMRVLPRARADRLALRFAVVSLVAFAAVGAAVHVLIVRDIGALSISRGT